jgi:hypothetical protein
MSKQQRDDRDEVFDKQEPQDLSAKIGDQVLRALGQPSDLNRVQIRRLWKDRYRINVLVGEDVVSARVAHSYFVVADGDGNIITSNPKITQKYGPSRLAVPSGLGDLPLPSAAT